MARDDDEYSAGVAFALWLACLFGVCGVHRFYLGKPATGLLYLFTFGLLGIGQVVDLIRLRGMVEEQNLIELGRQRRALGAGARALPAAPPRDPEEELRQALLKAAAARGGAISVTQGVLATGKSFEEVEAILDAMAKKGYADIGNDPKTGVVIYHFGDLA
ncbi:MAG TPA: TM2 domain-containing protein [Kofleriaceae bacterium]|nr:TM2 domain-containing protein [Kofleriaceae bacterium]